MPRQSEINRSWVVETIANPVTDSSGRIVHTSTEFTAVDEAFVVSVVGSGINAAGSNLPVIAQVVQSHLYPGGSSSLSATLAPGQFVIQVQYPTSVGTVSAPTALATLSSGTIVGNVYVIEHGT